jgi:hypothetical protein
MNEMIEEVDKEKIEEKPMEKQPKVSLLKKKAVEKSETPSASSFLPESFFNKIASNIVDVTPPSPPSSPSLKDLRFPIKVEEVEIDNVKSIGEVEEAAVILENEEDELKLKTPPRKINSKETKSKKVPPPPVRKLKKRGSKSQEETDDQHTLNV